MNITTIDVMPVSAEPIADQKSQFAADRLGPMPGKWDGYDGIADDDTRRKVYGKVGYIHGLSAEAGRTIIAIGETLLALKEMLPHGQFMACVKAEFGWSRQWAQQLMQVAERFTNVQSTGHLPSSAQVLALLAASDADDATVQQAAEERWTVQETKRRLGSERQRQRTLVQEALSALKLSAEARELAAKAQHITTRQLMDELGVEEPPKGKEHKTSQYTFCKNGTGWWKLPIEQPVDATINQEKPEHLNLEIEDTIADTTWEVVSIDEAADRMGIASPHALRNRLTPSSIQKSGLPEGNGWKANRYKGRSRCRIQRII